MNIVTAGIIEKDGNIFIAKRKTGTCIGKKWEFPGGKLEAGETPQECLRRELEEELSIKTQIGDYFCSSEFSCNDKPIKLMAFKVKYLSGVVKIIDHDEFKWVKPSELLNFDFVDPDKVIVNKLIKVYEKLSNYQIPKDY